MADCSQWPTQRDRHKLCLVITRHIIRRPHGRFLGTAVGCAHMVWLVPGVKELLLMVACQLGDMSLNLQLMISANAACA